MRTVSTLHSNNNIKRLYPPRRRWAPFISIPFKTAVAIAGNTFNI